MPNNIMIIEISVQVCGSSLPLDIFEPNNMQVSKFRLERFPEVQDPSCLESMNWYQKGIVVCIMMIL